MLPEEKINSIRENSRKIMSYITHQLSAADGGCVSEAQLEQLHDQAEERALGTVQTDAEELPTPPADPTLPSAPSPMQGMVAQYEAEVKKIISNHRDGIVSILKEGVSNEENSMLLASRCRNNFPIMTGLAILIMHLGGDEIPHADLSILADRAKEVALLLFTSYTAPKVIPPKAALENPSVLVDEKGLPMLPPTKAKASLKPSMFFPIFADQTPPRLADSRYKDDEDEEDKPGMYSKLDKGVGDRTHYSTASFVKTNEKIKDQLLTQVRYFLDLMSANIDGMKFHPLSTERSLPILTSSADKNYPTTGTKIRDYFHVQNKYFLIPGTRNKPKLPPQKVDADGRFQFDENRVYDGPDRITGIMLISAPCNVKQAISNLLIELEGDVHQKRYKPTQRKNSKAEKMFPGVPAVLCPEALMQSYGTDSKSVRKNYAAQRSSLLMPI